LYTERSLIRTRFIPISLPTGLPLTCLVQYAKSIPRSNLPIVLLAIAGNRLEVSTAVFTNAVYADKLVSIELLLGPHAQDEVLRVARIFMAISKCTAGLRTLYMKLETSPDRVPSVEFPNPTPDPPQSHPEDFPVLESFCKLDRVHGVGLVSVDADNERHGVYLARRPTGTAGDHETVLVKFTPKYNKTAHLSLSKHIPPLAPALYSCTPVVGGLQMVVMEYLSDAKPLYHFLAQSPRPPTPNVRAVRRDVAAALKILHENDFVFGDLREANVLYSPEAGGRAFLIDFDGVGKHGRDRYSPCLNFELGLGVLRWQIMEKSHDESNLERIISWLSAL